MPTDQVIDFEPDAVTAEKKVNLADMLTEATVATEGLLPGQTPIRITNKTMRGWNTIQGVPIDKTTPRPKDRNNFFFVAPGMENVVIKKQWQNYFKKPSRYGLSDDSSIEDAVKLFDQENPDNKLKYLQKNGIDTKKKIKDAKIEFDLSALNPFYTPDASADEIPVQENVDIQPSVNDGIDFTPDADDGIDFTPDADDGIDFVRGLEKSARQIPQLAYGTTALVADSIDVLFGGRDDDGPAGKARDWAMRGYKQAEEKIQSKAKENDDVIVAWNKAKEGDLGAMVEWASFMSGYGLGQVGESMAVGLAGALAGSAVLTPGVGTVAGGVGGVAQKGLMKKLIFNKVKQQADNILLKSAGKLTSFQAEKLAVKQMTAAIGAGAVLSAQNLMMEAGSIYPEAVDNIGKDLNGMDIARVWGSALAAGSVETASDVLGLGAVMGKLRIPGVGGRIAKGASGLATGAGIEGGTEAIQTVIERFGAQKPVMNDEGKREIINAAAAGALPGAFVGGTAGVLTSPSSPSIDEASKHGKVVGIDAKTKLPIIDTSAQTEPQTPAQSAANAPASPSGEALMSQPIQTTVEDQKPVQKVPDANEEVSKVAVQETGLDLQEVQKEEAVEPVEKVSEEPDESSAEIVPSEQDMIPQEQKNEIIDQNIMNTDKEIEDAQRTIPEQRREEIRQAVEKEENVDYDAAGNIITDFGEKIGGARKDTAKPLGPRVGTTEKERTPAWQKGIITLQDKDGRWRLYKDMGSGRVALISREAFESQEQASSMIPLAVVAHNHRVYTDNREKNTYGIFRLLSNGNRPLVKGGFKTEEEAKKFLALNAAQIIEHKFKFPEKPWLDKVVRKGGRQRANKNVSTKEFQDVFGFRAGEFGNWNMGSDGQAALNHAFDALYDLADTLGVDPKALSLNGRLAIAFGARGHGGEQAARAHYESDKVVINLTKIRGAGTLAHEWFHALDNHIANVDERKQGFATTGFKYNSKLSQDLRNAMKAVVDAMTAKVEDKPIDQDFAKKNSDRALDAFNELVNRLDRNFHYDLSSYRKNFKKPTPAQEAKWSELKNRLLALDVGEKIHVPPKNPRNMLAGYDSFQLIEEMNALYKQVQGNSFSRSDQDSLGRSLYHAIRRYRDYLVRVDEASKGKIESRKSATSYFKESKRIDDFRASQYWSTVEEMAARAFESYVFDKMAQKASQSDYLVHSVDNKLYRALLDMAPYPEGTEREAINKAFDNLMETIDDSILKKAPKQEAAQKNKGLIKEQDMPYGDKGKEDQYLDYLKTQRITKEYKNDKSYAADIERQIRKREGGLAEETTGYGKPAKTFYSQLERVIETKMPNAATPEMVRGLLSDKNGVKKEEYEWMGVEEFLEGKQKVTKAELQEFIRQNQVEVKEVFKGAAEGDNANIEKAFKEKGLDISVDPNGELLIIDKNGDELIFEDIEKSYPELLSLAEQYENNNGNPADVRGAPKFANYQLPGGKNYRELLLTLPDNSSSSNDNLIWKKNKDGKWAWFDKDVQASGAYPAEYDKEYARVSITPASRREKTSFKSSHFDEPNVLAHVRMNDRTDAEGKKVLFIEEVQSDWHQKGRKEGYASSGKKIESDADQTFRDLGVEIPKGSVPDAPFKKTWHELAMKRMLRYAAENGYDKLAWTTGEQQADRYDLSKHINKLEFVTRKDGSKRLVATEKYGNQVLDQKIENDSEIEKFVGKDPAKRLLEAQERSFENGVKSRKIEGADLKVGGEGMKGFYDQILPSFMNKYAKKWGGRVGQTDIRANQTVPKEHKEFGYEDRLPRVETKVHSIDITPSMKKSVVEEGQALFERPEQYQNVKMRYFNGEGQLVREEQLNFLKSEKEVSNGKGIPDRGREAGVAPTLNGRSLWKSPAALKFKKDGYLVMPDQKIEGPEDVAFAFQFLKDAAQEHFYIVPVKDGQALAAELITIGTYNSAQPAIYEILGLLEKTGADSVYMVHNHPNGRMEPSSDDMKFTTRAMGVLDKIKVKFNGHIIIDTDKFVFIKSGQNRGLTADVIPHKQYARTRKVEVLKKYMEWSAGKESTPQIKKADDIYEVIKGITVDPKSGIVVLLNNQMRIMNMYAMPQDKINANEIMRLSARERTSAVITVNTGMDTLTTLDLMDDLNDVGMKLLDDIEVTAPGKYISKQERGVLEAPEPYQGKIAEEGPKDIAPEDQFDALTPEEQAQFALEMDDLRKTPEGNLFIAIKRIGGIAPHRGGKLKEEYAEIPLFLKNNKGQPLDDFVSQLQQYGWNFETENELIQEINRQAANPVEKVDRASLRKIIRDAQKNKRLKGTIKEKLFGKRRKFIQTVKDSENTKPEVAKAVESRYEPISNKETMTKAQAFVAESPDEAVQMIESNIKPDAFHNAVGIELIRIAQNEGRIQDAVRLVERMAEKQTALGQAIQALSMYNRLSPEGILMAAQRSIRRAKDTLPRHKVDQFEKLARDMKNPKDVEKLAKRMGVPHMTEDLAKDLVERAKKIGSAPQWEMPSVPEAKNAIQNLIDEFYSLGVEGQNNLPPEVKNAIQFTINEFEKLGVDGENTPIAKNAIQKIFKEFESLGVDGENTPMGPGIQQFMDIGRIKAARSGLIETALMLQKIQNQIPRTIWEKISMAQTIAQLLNPKTFIRNLLGNLIFQATENLADTVGAAIDIAVALNTGKRSVYLPNVKTQVKGAIQGFKEGYEEAVLGIDLKGQTLSKFTLPKNGVFNGGVMGGLEKTLRVALGATDRAFYQSAFNQSLEQQLKASGKKEIDEDMIERAHAIGLYRTFQDENILSRQFEQLKRWFNAGGKFGLGDVVLKYPRTPANLLHRGIEYSPFGFLHTVMRIADPLIFGKEFDQERFVRQTSRALTGSALLVGAGAVLAALGIISGKRSKDPDIVETRRNSGIREYQINTSALKRFIMSGMNPDQAKMQEGDTLVSYDWMQPASIGIALGANMVLDPRTNLVDKTVNFADSMLQASETLQEQPLVRGVKTFTSRRNIAEGLSEVVKDMPASFVPTILNQVRQLTDNIARNTQDPNYLAEAGKKVAMRIPGASRALPAQINTLGEARQMYQDDSNSIFNVFFNPAFVSRYRPDPVSKMVLDIWGKTGETVQFPRTAPRSVKVPDSTEPLVLDPEQYQLFASYIGKKTNVLFNMKLEDPVFMALPDTEKAKKLESYLTDIKQAAMIEVLGIRPKGTDRGTMYIIKQIKADLEKIKANEEDGIDFQPYSDVPEGFR